MSADEFPPLIYVDLIKVKPDDSIRFHSKRGVKPGTQELAYRAYLDSFQPWRWVAKSADNQRKLARSSERYFNRADCEGAIWLLFGSGSNVYLREAEHGNQVLRMAGKTDRDAQAAQ